MYSTMHIYTAMHNVQVTEVYCIIRPTPAAVFFDGIRASQVCYISINSVFCALLSIKYFPKPSS